MINMMQTATLTETVPAATQFIYDNTEAHVDMQRAHSLAITWARLFASATAPADEVDALSDSMITDPDYAELRAFLSID